MRSLKIIVFLLFGLTVKLNAQNLAIDSLKRLISEHKNNEEEAISMMRLGVQFTRYDMNLAKYYTHTGIKLATKINSNNALSSCYSLLVSIYYNTGMLDSAHFFLNKAKIIANNSKVNDPFGINNKANYEFAAGLLARIEGDYKNALSHTLAALSLAEKSGRLEDIAGKNLNVGNIYVNLARYKDAIIYHLKALNLFLQIHNQRGESFCYQALADDFTKLKLYPQALKYAMEAQALKKRLNDTRGASSSSLGLAIIYRGLNNYKEAINHLSTALQVAKSLNLSVDEMSILTEMGLTYNQMGEVKKAEEYFNSAKISAIKNDDLAAISAIDSKLLNLHIGKDATKQSEQLLLQAVEKSRIRGDKQQELDSYKYLAKFYTVKKDFEKALFYNEKYHSTVSSIQNTELALQIKMLEEKFNVERKEKEIALLKKDQKINKAHLEKQTTLKLAAITVSGLVFFMILLVAYRKRTIQRAKGIIEMDRMRTSIARDLHDDIGSRLTNIQFLTELFKQPNSGLKTERDYIQDICEELLASTEALDEIVWNMKTIPDEQGTLPIRMRRYAGEVFDDYDIDYEMNVGNNVNDMTISHEKQRDIFLIYKELLTNIRKHADAKRVRIDFNMEHNIVVLSIHDDGTGFKYDEASAKGRNGLQNIKSRVEKWQGSVFIESNNGTLISISMPQKLNVPNNLRYFFSRKHR